MIKINIGKTIKLHELDELVPSQGDLKELTEKNYLKLKSEILTDGFVSPFFIWYNEHGLPELLDGHQRRLVLLTMRDTDKLDIPKELPCVEINAESRERAAKILLALTSQYGTITTQGLYKYAHENDISIDEMVNRFEFDKFSMEDFKIEFMDGESRERNLGDDFEDIEQKKKQDKKLCPHCGMEL